MSATKKLLRTVTGTPLTDEYEARLTDEAEAGFDPEGLERRGPGRPSLSHRSGRSARVHLRVDDDTHQEIQRIAAAQHRRVSDVVREAISRYLAEAG